MSEPFDIIAVITPKPGKADRVQELLETAAAAVKANEPGVLRYHVQRETKGDAPVFIMLETYKNKEALGVHGASPDFKALGRALKKEDLLAAPMKAYFTKEVGGYASKL
ncbi:antibiotic biosynthesis monooxygenase-like protein [Melanomma pulvis-pyrius CBS 109.77]|uniref:Antibiotic biosynthesis monooxygenase-like protein n=1 Tax=Melanomma pulvis-pyrius CBS 109.77 TaxID=1314802 RepID=A0A6A6XUZ7_9PLEO|nr:antibiotic biosynthesis monooxygenase-like protein [Melanomma pulvis-pyrius CBS 109.77]